MAKADLLISIVRAGARGDRAKLRSSVVIHAFAVPAERRGWSAWADHDTVGPCLIAETREVRAALRNDRV